MEQSHIFIPDGPAYLTAYLEHYLDFTDVYTDYDPKRLLGQKPDIIGLSAVTESINHIITLAKEIKKIHNVPIIIGGPHITYLPKTLPKEIDIGVMGEGEETFLELMKLALANELVPEKLREVQGIVFHDHDGIRITPSRPLIQDIDTIPLPKRQVSEIYQPVYQNVFTSRGCPYKCTYCIETRFWTRTRFHSPERVMAEIEQIIRQFPEQTSISMGDTIFAMNKKRLKRISEMVVESGIHKKVYFGCNARANIFDEEVCEILRAMNVKEINCGFESGSDKILDFLKGSVKAKQNEKALDLCEKYGFIPLGHIIIGAPVETVEDSAQSYWFLQRNRDRLWRASIHPMTPFPGSFIWNYAAEKGLIDESFTDWENFNLSHVPSVFLNENYSHEEYIMMGAMFDEYQLKKQQPDNYLIHYTNKDLYFDFVYRQVAEVVNKNTEAKVLEITSHPLRISDFLSAEIVVESLTGKNGYLSFSDQDEEKYDFILLTHSLETFREPEKILLSLKRLLKKSGKIICVFFNAKNKEFLRMFFEEGGIKTFIWGPTSIRNLDFFTLKNINKIFENIGYREPKLIQTNINPTPASKYSEILQKFFKIEEKELDITSYVISWEK